MGRLLNLGKKNMNMKKCQIFIRVDSGIEIGTGHAIRCLSLAQVLKKMNFEPCFISKKTKGNISKFFMDKGFMVYYIQNSCRDNVILGRFQPSCPIAEMFHIIPSKTQLIT